MGGEKIRLIVAPEAVGQGIEQIVSDDGYIALPTGGEPLNIKGKSITEAQKLAEERITKAAGARIPQVAIALINIPPRVVYVGGEGIKTSQGIIMSGGAPMTLYAAVLAAGGVAPEGDPTRVSVSRTLSDGSIKSDSYDITRFGEAGSKTLGPLLEPGDVVKVPRSEAFVLAGEVNKAGAITRREMAVPPGVPVRVSNVVYSTGGLKQGANRSNIRIVRTDKDGNRRVLKVDMDAPSGKADGKGGRGGGAAPGDPELEDGDLVIVDAGGTVPVLGRVRLPGMYPMNGNTLKLSRAIALAGGFADFAKQSSVIVLKASNNYAPKHVDMSLIQKGGFQDEDLEEGDLVYVGERML